MLHIARILFPTDFSESAEQAYPYAAHLAETFGAYLHVLNVSVPYEEDADDPFLHLHLAREDDLTRSDAYALTHRPERIPTVHAQVRRLAPAEGILTYAASHDVDLIVMGTHGRRGLGRLLMGSTAEEVVRRADCPVLTVRSSAVTRRAVGRILVPVDFSEFMAAELGYARALAEAYGAQIDLLHVVEQPPSMVLYGLEPLPALGSDGTELARSALDSLADALRAEGRTCTVHVRVDNAAYGILEAAHTLEADLIVMATHGLTGRRHFLLGSVAEKVVRAAPCPVFTLKSFGKSLLSVREEDVVAGSA